MDRLDLQRVLGEIKVEEISLKEIALKFNIGSHLGDGGFGSVKSCIRECDKKPVALKFLPKNHPNYPNKDARADFFREIAILHHLKELDNVIGINSQYDTEDYYIIEMELFLPTIPRNPVNSPKIAFVCDLFEFIDYEAPVKEKASRHIFSNILRYSKKYN